MSASTVDYQRDGNVVTLRLDRPAVMNSLCIALHRDLNVALDAAERDPGVRCLVLTGTGRGFCAGQDLGETEVLNSADAGRVLEHYYNPLVMRLRQLPLPIVCAVNGTAAGAGVSLALACDLVLAARSAQFIQAFVRIGLVPDLGGTWFLPRLIGEARARALAITGEAITAEQAADWGLIWRCVDDAELAAAAHEQATRLAAMPTRAIALIKQAFMAGATHDLATQLALERQLQREAGTTGDAREGVAAFREKRPPQFSGR